MIAQWKARRTIVLAAIAALCLSAFAAGQTLDAQTPSPHQQQHTGNSTDAYQWTLPSWISAPPEPPTNPVTVAKVELGRRLFYDGRLAADGMRSCASCHQQERGFSDGSPFSWGVTGQLTARNTPALANVGYAPTLTWANPMMTSLELQARSPLFGTHPVEMGMAGLEDELTVRLGADPIYQELFPRAFPEVGGAITVSTITAAIGTFERTLVSATSPYDAWRHGAQGDAISESAKRGETLFFSDRLKCGSCHGGPHFSGDVGADGAFRPNFQNNGLYNIDGSGAYPESNPGLIANTARPEDMGRFKVPSLRNIAVTNPYMHDGSLQTLDEVLDHYAAGGRLIPAGSANAGDGRASPLKSPLVTGFQLSAQERADLIAFLEALTDESFLTDPRFSDPWK
ncbi:MAG: di-heme enzyme [Hyphomonadaceae bacterium]